MLFERLLKTRPLVEVGFLGHKVGVLSSSTLGTAGSFKTGKPARIAEDFIVLRALKQHTYNVYLRPYFIMIFCHNVSVYCMCLRVKLPSSKNQLLFSIFVSFFLIRNKKTTSSFVVCLLSRRLSSSSFFLQFNIFYFFFIIFF